MRKRYLKRWVETSLLIIFMVCLLVLMCDSSDIKVFIISKLIALIIMGVILYIIEKYGRL